jgi:hypothetical protein
METLQHGRAKPPPCAICGAPAKVPLELLLVVSLLKRCAGCSKKKLPEILAKKMAPPVY